MTNKWLYSLIAVCIVLALGVGVYAYQSNMRAGNPPVMGPSAGEIHVENSSGEIVSLQDALDDLGDQGTEYYKVVAPKNSRGTTITIPESVIIDYCGDEDGCRLRSVMYDWAGTGRSASVDNLFYYNPQNRNWRDSHERSDSMGQNNDGATSHVDQWWACYFTDGKYNSWSNLGDSDTDFGLLSWSQYNAECRLFIYD